MSADTSIAAVSDGGEKSQPVMTDDGTAAVTALLKKIARGPAMPPPDPGAHSWQAYSSALRVAMLDGMRWAAEALAILDGKMGVQAATPQQSPETRGTPRAEGDAASQHTLAAPLSPDEPAKGVGC